MHSSAAASGCNVTSILGSVSCLPGATVDPRHCLLHQFWMLFVNTPTALMCLRRILVVYNCDGFCHLCRVKWCAHATGCNRTCRQNSGLKSSTSSSLMSAVVTATARLIPANRASRCRKFQRPLWWWVRIVAALFSVWNFYCIGLCDGDMCLIVYWLLSVVSAWILVDRVSVNSECTVCLLPGWSSLCNNSFFYLRAKT